MESDEAARKFLNNVKGVFGVKGCYYLISVSDEAMGSFERRGLPFRDVFDSSFDAIQRIGYLSFEESQRVLESRVIGLPVPFQGLCHCLAGGLPRDLIRVTRELVQAGQRSSESTGLGLQELSLVVVRREQRGKVSAALEASRSVQGEAAEWLVRWLHEQDAEAVTAGRLRGWHETLTQWGAVVQRPTDTDDERRAREIAIEIDFFNYFAATVLEFFGDEARFSEIVRPAELGGPEIDPVAVNVLEAIAGARQRFAISPWLAWDAVAGARDAFSAERWGDPRSGRGG